MFMSLPKIRCTPFLLSPDKCGKKCLQIATCIVWWFSKSDAPQTREARTGKVKVQGVAYFEIKRSPPICFSHSPLQLNCGKAGGRAAIGLPCPLLSCAYRSLRHKCTDVHFPQALGLAPQRGLGCCLFGDRENESCFFAFAEICSTKIKAFFTMKRSQKPKGASWFKFLLHSFTQNYIH